MNGLIKWFARNPVAANLLMLALLVGGFLTLPTYNREIMPSMPIRSIRVQVVYPGGNPAEVEDRISVRIEEAIHDVEGVTNIKSLATEGLGTVDAEIETNANPQKVLGEIKAKVDAILTFPKNSERPTVELNKFRSRAIQLAVIANTDENSLKSIAEDIRDEIGKLPGVDFAETVGVREYELGIEVSEDSLMRYGLTFDEVAQAVRNSSLNLPAGVIQAEGGDISLRTRSQAYTAEDFAKIVLIKNPDGTKIYLGDVAKIIDGFVETPVLTRFNNRPAVMINVLFTTNPDVVGVANRVKKYIKTKSTDLPDGVELVGWLDLSKSFKSRVNILTNSGLGGLVL
ncbi:MAG TPA: efflux RND transporter permease subunit, partial [Hellea balneolensis]|nr:efflux RND transporter permease subunit [Hellea balneolensis]